MRYLLIAMFAAALGTCGSDKAKDEPEDERVAPMSETEVERGDDACKQYVERLCKCAGAQPKLGELCEKERAIVSALRMLVQMNRAGIATEDERIVSAQKARETVSKCITETAKLDARGCD